MPLLFKPEFLKKFRQDVRKNFQIFSSLIGPKVCFKLKQIPFTRVGEIYPKGILAKNFQTLVAGDVFVWEKEPKMKTNRTGIWIPVWIENLNLSHSQTKLYAEIVSLHDKGGCFASNRYFGEVLGLKIDTVSRLITSLKKLGLLEQTGFDGRRRFLKPLFAKPTTIEFESKDKPSEKNPIRETKPFVEKLQARTFQKSNAESESFAVSIFSTIEVQKKVQKKGSWEEFKSWSERTLSKSTSCQIANITSPEFLQGASLLIWKNWMEKQKSFPNTQIQYASTF